MANVLGPTKKNMTEVAKLNMPKVEANASERYSKSLHSPNSKLFFSSLKGTFCLLEGSLGEGLRYGGKQEREREMLNFDILQICCLND